MTGNERGTNVQLFDRLDDTVHHALPEHERMVLDAVRQLAREKIAPRAAALDAEQRFPRDNIADINALELNRVFIPEEYVDRQITRLNSSHLCASRIPSSPYTTKT